MGPRHARTACCGTSAMRFVSARTLSANLFARAARAKAKGGA
jgi:hypothetical protein